MLNIRSSFWAISSNLFRAGGALLTLPIALTVIPESEMGLYYSFLSLSAFAVLLDLGFGQTLVRFSSHAWAGAEGFFESGVPPKPDKKRPNLVLLQKLMTAARFWYVVMGIIVALILIVPGGVFINHQINGAALPKELIYCWLVMSVAVGFSFASEFWRTILFGIGGLSEAHQVSIAAQIGSVLITAAALLFGLGLWSFPLARFSIAILNRFFAKRFLRERINITLSSWHGSGVLIATMWPMAWRQGVVAIGEFLVLRAGVIICASLFGLELTARYGLTLQIIGVITAVCGAPLAVAMPLISEFRIHRKSENIVKIFVRRAYLGIFFIFIFGVAAINIVPWLLMLIGSNTALLDTGLFMLLLIIQILNFHQGSWTALVLTENKNPFVIPVILTGLLVISVSWYLGSKYGLYGMILGQAIVPLLYLNWWSVIRGFKGLGISIRHFFKSLNG